MVLKYKTGLKCCGEYLNLYKILFCKGSHIFMIFENWKVLHQNNNFDTSVR